MEEIQNQGIPAQVSPTQQPTQTAQSPNPWESVAQAWQAIATRASNLVPASPQNAPAQSPISSDPSGEVQADSLDPVVQGWLDQGIQPSDINQILSVVPYTANCPAIAGDFEAMALLANDPDFDQFKNDPAYWARLNENLQDEGVYNQGLPVSGQFQQEPLSFPPNFSTWGNTASIHPFYQQDPVTLGRMLAEMGGDYDPGYRY